MSKHRRLVPIDDHRSEDQEGFDPHSTGEEACASSWLHLTTLGA